MDRLTYDFYVGGHHCWQVKGADNLECREVCERQGDEGCKTCPIAKAFDRLAAYEDTGLAPEEVQQMRWIPLEEGPPEEIGLYLVVACDEHLPRDERIWNGTIMGEGFYGEEDWDMEYSGYIHDVTGMVTHWMSFPNFPEEEPNGKK